MLPHICRKAATPEDIARAKQDGVHCLYMMCNGVPLPEDWVSPEEELRYIRVFFEFGCRMMHLTYNRTNVIGGGCGESTNIGLTDFGRAVVGEMNRVGVIVDVAHSSCQTGFDAARASKAPIVSSHAICTALNAHCRSKPNDLIRAIADTGGLCGICCIPNFLGGTGDIRAFLDHIDHVARTVGTDYAAIGTDVAYSQSTTEQEWKKVPERRRGRMRFASLWPGDSISGDARYQKPEQTLSMAWTNWPIFTVGLVQRGYSDEDIRKILGGNVLRVAKAVFAARENPYVRA
jgi:membrane dipeptidase